MINKEKVIEGESETDGQRKMNKQREKNIKENNQTIKREVSKGRELQTDG